MLWGRVLGVRIMSKVEVEIVKLSKDILEVKVKGEGHTLLNLLVDELNKDPRVTAAYRVEHPLLDVAFFMVKTDGSISPLNALKEVQERVIEKLESVKRQVLEQVSKA